MTHTILLVDDEPFNLELMSELLEEAGYDTVQAENGDDAWAILEKEGTRFASVLLDKMMPGLNGFDVLRRIKANPDLQFLPVIMQTAMGAAASVQEGLDAGAFYYLTKPFSREMLLAVLNAAVSHWDRHASFKEMAAQQTSAMQHLDSASFSCRTIKEAQHVTALLAQSCSQPERVATGLFELLVNAIEHGNLGITYQEKTALQASGRWTEELERRIRDPLLGARRVRVDFRRETDRLCFTITDEGDGFDWQAFQGETPAALIDTHGRGILIARKLSFSHLEYHGCGNSVTASLLF